MDKKLSYQNLYDDELSPLSLDELNEKLSTAKDTQDNELRLRINKELKRRGRKQGKNKLSF